MEVDVRFVLLTFNAPGGKEIWAAMSEAEQDAEEAEYRDLIQAMRTAGVFLAANEVEHHDKARTVRVREDGLSVSDGPAARADEYLTGYFKRETPRSTNSIPAPATRSLTVRVASTSPGCAKLATRAQVWTAMPATFSPISSHSPVCRPARTSTPSGLTPCVIAHAHGGAGNVPAKSPPRSARGARRSPARTQGLGTLAQHLVSDVNVSAVRVLRLRLHAPTWGRGPTMRETSQDSARPRSPSQRRPGRPG
jgi:hypothetical protein